jgi:hypothetical protein
MPPRLEQRDERAPLSFDHLVGAQKDQRLRLRPEHPAALVGAALQFLPQLLLLLLGRPRFGCRSDRELAGEANHSGVRNGGFGGFQTNNVSPRIRRVSLQLCGAVSGDEDNE